MGGGNSKNNARKGPKKNTRNQRNDVLSEPSFMEDDNEYRDAYQEHLKNMIMNQPESIDRVESQDNLCKIHKICSNFISSAKK
jgi:hypothetical protein